MNLPEPLPIESYDLIGGDLALDFVNTASCRDRGPLIERLNEYEDLLRWGTRLGVLSEGRASGLRLGAAADPASARAVLSRALELREVIYRVFAAQASERTPERRDLELLDAEYRRASSRQKLIAVDGGFSLGWAPEEEALDQVLWPVAVSATDLLTSGDLARVKECATDNCNWLFLDLSRNRSRRWCDMKDCGNRAKARRHYHRHRRGE